MSRTPLSGQVALVTGGARGIGRLYALRLANLGADVAVLDVDLRSFAEFEAEKALMDGETTMAEIEALGRRAIGQQVDVTDSEAVTAAVDAIVHRWGRLDVVVCNAGGGVGQIGETTASLMPDTAWHAVMQRNLDGTMHTCRAAIPSMMRQRSGRLITVSSIAGTRPEPSGGYAHYGAAKAAIAMYTRYLAREVGPHGITANCIAPGYIRTGRLAPIHDAMGAEVLDKIALRRFGTADDCAGAVEFLATDLGAYVTGTVIAVDGGAL